MNTLTIDPVQTLLTLLGNGELATVKTEPGSVTLRKNGIGSFTVIVTKNGTRWNCGIVDRRVTVEELEFYFMCDPAKFPFSRKMDPREV